MTELEEWCQNRDVTALRSWIDHTGTLEIADELSRLPPSERAVAFRLLRKHRALDVFEALDPVHQQELLDGLREQHVRDLIEGMSADDRVRLLDEMPAKVALRLQAGLSPRERQLTARLLGYEERSAGRIMSPEFVNLRSSMTVAAALEKLRRAGRQVEFLAVLPVTDDERRLNGVTDLRTLVVSSPDAYIADIMQREVHSVRVNEDQEVAARLMLEADLLALPVLDTEDRLVGVITVDDAMEVLEAEETEDFARTGGSEPLNRPYLAASPTLLARRRAPWLLLLIVAGALTVSVLQIFEGALQSVATLAVFIPLLIGSGGNAGSQASTTIVRAMAVGEVRLTDLPRIIFREASVGIALGAMLAAVIALPVAYFYGSDFVTIIATSLLVICTWACIVGSTLPLLAQRFGIDPAVISAPFVTTLVDATGLVIYFLIAGAVLGPQLAGG